MRSLITINRVLKNRSWTMASATLQQTRTFWDLPINTGILFVPQQEAWIVERSGKFLKVLEPGLNFLIPVVDRIRYVHSLKEISVEVPEKTAITADNVNLTFDGVLFVSVLDPYKASYTVANGEYAITQLALTATRSEICKMNLDTLFRERKALNLAIMKAINKIVGAWGVECKRYEIRDIKLPIKFEEAMQMQISKRRTQILEIEGEAEAIIATANAKVKALEIIAEALAKENVNNAASVAMTINAFSNLAKENTNNLPVNAEKESGWTAQVTQKLEKEIFIRS